MIGEKVGNYVVESELGRGGMGVVYRARHVALGRPAAIKVLLPQFSSHPDVVQRFFNEAKAATLVRHLGIVEIYDFGLLDTGVAFIAMELLTGESLAARMARRSMSLQDGLGTIRQICGALGAAHDRGIVHRDLKPDNVFLISDAEVHGGERIKLLDFGIAKLSQDASGLASQTQTGAVIGTPKYMAPEQCRGVKVDHRADIYAIGCILYELVTGRTPFRGEGAGDVLAAHIYATPEPIERLSPATPGAVVRLVGRLLAKSPDARPQTARQVIHAIDELRAGALAEDPRDPRFAVVAGRALPPRPTAGPTIVDPTSALARDDGGAAGDDTVQLTGRSGPVASTQARMVMRRRRGLLAGLGAALAGGVAVMLVAMRTDGGGSGAGLDPGVASVQADSAGAATRVDGARSRELGAAPAVALDAAVATSAMVQVTLDSVPPGAHVWLDGVDLGVTPYAGALPRAEREVVFSLRRDRFKDYAVKARAMSDIHADARLVARGAGAGHVDAAHVTGGGTAPVTQRARRPDPPAHVPLDDDDTPNPLGAH